MLFLIEYVEEDMLLKIKKSDYSGKMMTNKTVHLSFRYKKATSRGTLFFATR